MGNFEKPEVIYDEQYEDCKWENSLRGRAYPYVLGTLLAILLILISIKNII